MTFYLHAAGRMHALVATQVGELRVGFKADLASERFDTAVDVRVLF